MAKHKYRDTIIDIEGRPVLGASIYVFQRGLNVLQPIFEDDETTPKANPMTSNSWGYVDCMVESGTYDIVVVKTDFVKRIDKVFI